MTGLIAGRRIWDAKPRRSKPKRAQLDRTEAVAALAEAGDDSQHGFDPSFTGSKHERQWIMTYLGPFYQDQVITDVLRQVKGGKEATVYCCRANPAIGVDLIAAKVYRPRMFRQLRDDAVYRKGREVIGEEGKEVSLCSLAMSSACANTLRATALPRTRRESRASYGIATFCIETNRPSARST